MDTRFQPEGLSFDSKNTFNPTFDNNSGNYGQYSAPASQQQNQYPSQSGSDQRQYTPQPQQPSQYSAPVGARIQTPPQQQTQYGPPSGPRLSNPVQGQYSPPSNNQQQSQERQFQQVQYQPQSPPRWDQKTPNLAQQERYSVHSGQSSRSNTWVTTPAPPFPNDGVYYTGPVDANGYPMDIKDRQQPVENPFRDPAPQLPPAVAIPQEDDIEKLKHDNHSGWTYHDKLPGRKDPNQPYLPFSQRIQHFTWANYTLTMATGGIATLISIQPHKFPGLITIGAIFYILNIIFFTAITMTMILRFTKFPGSFKASITHEREGLFLGPFFLSIATIITGTQKFVIEAYEPDHPNRDWAITTMAVAFWAYTFVTFCLAVFQYSFLFCCHTYKLTSFMPSWLLPIFPIMLAGTIASVIGASQPVSARMPILVAGLGCQGLGFTMAIIMYAHFIGRLMQVGYPGREHRGAMFIGVGPPSFTCLALIGMANALPDEFDLQMDGLIDAKMLRTLALVCALFLWVLAMWFFMITLVSVINSWALYFHLGWWAMVFPNTGFVLATINIGNALRDETILFVANGLSIAVITMWFYVLFNHIRAIYVVDIFYPGMDEDNADH